MFNSVHQTKNMIGFLNVGIGIGIGIGMSIGTVFVRNFVLNKRMKTPVDKEFHNIELKDFSQKGIFNIAKNIGKDAYDGFYDKLVQLDDTKPLKITIETDGGSLFRLQKIMRNLKRRNNKIIAIVEKSAHSAGSILALSCDELHMSQDASLSAIDPQYIKGINFAHFENPALKLASEYFQAEESQSRLVISDHLKNNLKESRDTIKTFLNKKFSGDTKENVLSEMFDKPVTHEKIFFIDDLKSMGVEVKMLD